MSRKMINPCIYVLLNTELKMDAGKAMAQACHAVAGMMSSFSPFDKQNFFEIIKGEYDEKNDKTLYFHQYDPRTMIILDGKNADLMTRFQDYLNSDNIKLRSYIYTDEGSGFQKTAMAVEPVDKEDARSKLIFNYFSLYEYKDTRIEELEKYMELYSDWGWLKSEYYRDIKSILRGHRL